MKSQYIKGSKEVNRQSFWLFKQKSAQRVMT